MPFLERNVLALAVTVVTVLGAIQQNEAIRVHGKARLRRAALVNPCRGGQLFRRHLYQRLLAHVLRCHVGQLVPAVDAHPEGLLLARAALAADRAAKLRC